MNCPYCALRASDSDDHIFPQFLGGRATVPACNQCNSTFGHTIEASAFEHFKDWMFVFRRSGMAPPKPMIWRRGAIDDSGRRYDVDQDFKAVLSNPIITRDDEGQISAVEGSPKEVAKIAKSLQEKGAKFTEPKVSNITIDMQSLTLRYPLDQDLQRLALKISIACVRRLGRELRISDYVRSYLLDGPQAESNNMAPVRVTLQRYGELDILRPRLGHLVYVRSSQDDVRTYSILQFFGFIQLYCDFRGTSSDDSFSILATHDPISHSEDFREISSINYAMPPQFGSAEDWRSGTNAQVEKMRLELVDLYGDQAPQSLSINHS
jgi:HNH endonuclease